MKQALSEEIEPVLTKARELLAALDVKQWQQQLQELEKATYQPDFWSQQEQAQATMQQISQLQAKIEQAQQIKQQQQDLQALLDLAAEKEDKQPKLERELTQQFAQFRSTVESLELTRFLDSKYDSHGAMLSIHAGQGGTEAMDWAEMLQRMYVRYFERQGWEQKFISESRGEEAGIKSVEYEIPVPYAYGYLKYEAGTHRLVRQSPFNADNLRQTSFALVEVLPLIEDGNDQIKINETDLRWQFSRSGGAGGQNVNKVNTAVELTHLPTQIVVKCREERTQVQNKARALKKLRAILAQKEEQENQQKLQQVKGQHTDATWGTQIRNYVLHPYQLVKDTRTNYETRDTEAVLNGELDQFIQESVRKLKLAS